MIARKVQTQKGRNWFFRSVRNVQEQIGIKRILGRVEKDSNFLSGRFTAQRILDT